jgi:hypothetical protein
MSSEKNTDEVGKKSEDGILEERLEYRQQGLGRFRAAIESGELSCYR